MSAALVTSAACLNCDQACHDTGRGATWVHTGTGQFKCVDHNGVPLDTWCEPSTADTREAAEQKVREQAQEDCADGHDALEESARDEGWAMCRDRVETKCAEFERRFVGDDDVPGQGLIYEFIDAIREAANNARP